MTFLHHWLIIKNLRTIIMLQMSDIWECRILPIWSYWIFYFSQVFGDDSTVFVCLHSCLTRVCVLLVVEYLGMAWLAGVFGYGLTRQSVRLFSLITHHQQHTAEKHCWPQTLACLQECRSTKQKCISIRICMRVFACIFICISLLVPASNLQREF